MKIIVDENIPYGKEAFSNLGNVSLLNGRSIINKICTDADILIVRSITNINKELLDGTNIRFVGSATTGDDHIDKKFLDENNIHFYVAAGCNAHSVVEYVFAAITHFAIKNEFTFDGKKLGIIGVGKIGSQIAKIGKALGFEIILNDPPLQRETGSQDYRPLEEVLSADIITCHVPLNKTGIDKTYHLIDEKILSIMKPGTIFINSSRGSVIDNSALKQKLQIKRDLSTVLDVWENEPDIDKELLQLVDIGTAHIAGYSIEGKVNGTSMVYNELCRFLNVEPTWQPDLPVIEQSNITIEPNNNIEPILNTLYSKIYKIANDDLALRSGINLKTDEWPKHFDKLRKHYPIRREFTNYHLNAENFDQRIVEKLKTLRLNIHN